MKNKKFLIIAMIVIVVALAMIVSFFKKPSEIEKQDKEMAKDFEKLNNQVIDVTYSKTTNQLSSNAINLGDDFTVALDNYQYNENDDSRLNLTVGFFRGDTELANVMYEHVLYNKTYFFYGGLNVKQYKEFKSLRDYTEEYEQAYGMGITRINGEEETSKLIEDMIVFSFYDEFEISDLSFSLYNIKYQIEGNPEWHSIDNQRVTFNINIEE